MSYPEKSKQTKGKYLTGDILRMKDGSVGVVGEVNYNDCQEDPHYCKYSLNCVNGFYLEYSSWWHETEVVDAILGPAHALEEWREKYGKRKPLAAR